MREFDGGASQSVTDRVIGQTAQVLLFPGTLVWTRWASENLPSIVEWMVLIANSVLWGSMIALVVVRLTR
jgi:hypothetical protein